MKNILVLLISSLLLVGCVTYRQPARPQIVSVLAINSNGDTIQVSTDYLEREFRTNPGAYSNWRFQWENSWYWGNGWFNYYNPYWYNPRFYYPQRPIIIQRPRVSTPRVQPQPKRTYVPRHVEPRGVETPIRGRSNQTQPRVQQPQPRVQQPTRQPQRTQSPVRQQQRPKTTNGGRPIKQ
jgi:hypothetical protein